MACYRLTFESGRVFEVVIESTMIAGELREVHAATIYRVIDDVRDYQPIRRSDGSPIQVTAASETTALDTATHVLGEATISRFARVGECGNRSRLPPLPVTVRRDSRPVAPALTATLTCPLCAHVEVETMPTTSCQYFYDCKGCGAVLRPKPGGCCVYCSFSDQRCPPQQENPGCCGRKH